MALTQRNLALLNSRFARMAVTSGVATISNVIASGTSLVMVPLSLRYVGAEYYGIWMTVLAAASFLSLADLGVSFGIQNCLAERMSEDDTHAIRSYTRAAFGIVGLASALSILIALLYLFLSSSNQSPILSIASIVLFCGLGANVARVTKSAQFGLQVGHKAYFWEAIGSLLVLLVAVIVIWFDLGNITFIGMVSILPIIAQLMNTFQFSVKWRLFTRQGSDITTIESLKLLVRRSFAFFFLYGLGLIAYNTDALLIAYFLDSQSVATYAVAAKLFSVPVFIINLALAPLWAMYSEAFSSRDYQWVRSAFHLSLLLSVLVSVPSVLALVYFGEDLIEWWVAGAVTVDSDLLIAFSVWTVVLMVGTAYATLLNGLYIVRFQAVIGLLMVLANLSLSIYLTSRIGICGAVWGSALSVGLFVIVPSVVFVSRLLKELPERFDAPPL